MKAIETVTPSARQSIFMGGNRGFFAVAFGPALINSINPSANLYQSQNSLPSENAKPLLIYVIGRFSGTEGEHFYLETPPVIAHSRRSLPAFAFSLFLPGSVTDVTKGQTDNETRLQNETMEGSQRSALAVGRPFPRNRRSRTLCKQALRLGFPDHALDRSDKQSSEDAMGMAGRQARTGQTGPRKLAAYLGGPQWHCS